MPKGNPRAKLSENRRYYCREIEEPEAFVKPGSEILVSLKAVRILLVMLSDISVQVRCRALTSSKYLGINRSEEEHVFLSRGR